MKSARVITNAFLSSGHLTPDPCFGLPGSRPQGQNTDLPLIWVASGLPTIHSYLWRGYKLWESKGVEAWT
jgi:hypothetical protein